MKRKNELRDKIIRKTYKHGQGAVIGRWWHISRQRVWQIRQSKGIVSRRWWLLWLK